MKLLYSSASPYSAKTRFAAHYLGLPIEAVVVDTNNPPSILTDNNPLSKIPVLVVDNGPPVYDSVAIMHFMDRLSGGKLYPTDHDARTKAEVLEALCDGTLDCLLAIVYERRFRPAEIVHQPWIEKQWAKVEDALDYLESNLPLADETLHGGHFALAALLSYIELRFSGQWQSSRPNLAAWPDSFQLAFPDFATLKPGA